MQYMSAMISSDLVYYQLYSDLLQNILMMGLEVVQTYSRQGIPGSQLNHAQQTFRVIGADLGLQRGPRCIDATMQRLCTRMHEFF